MNEPIWKYINSDNTVVWRELPDGRQESHLVTAPEIQKWLDEGNIPEPADPIVELAPLTPQEKLAASGLTVEELKTLLGLK